MKINILLAIFGHFKVPKSANLIVLEALNFIFAQIQPSKIAKNPFKIKILSLIRHENR